MDFSTAETVHPLVQYVCGSIQKVLSAHLAGLYLFGSLVLGDFDLERSDIGLLAVTTQSLSDD